MIKDAMRKMFHRCTAFLSRSALLSKVAQRIADYRRGNNNPDMATNGEFDFLKKHAAGLRVAFDVGANKGDWTREALKINPDLTIIAFEPDPAMYAAFMANGFPKNVSCENKGLGARKEKRVLYVHRESPGMNSFVKRTLFNENDLVPKDAAVDTVDAYCAEHGISHIDFMKVDVEGFEMDVLRGAQNMIRKKAISIIQFEYGGAYLDSQESLKNAFIFFKSAGYAFYKLLPRSAVRIDKYSPVLEDYSLSNYAAIAP